MSQFIPVKVIKSSLSTESDSAIQAYLADISDACGIPLREVSEAEYVSADFALVFVATGGSECIFRSMPVPEKQKTVYILTHGASNSLAASMEILSYLQQQGRRGEILHGGRERIALRIRALAAAANALQKLRGMRLGVIGQPSDWLIASGYDAALCRSTLGIEIVEIPMDELIREYHADTYRPNDWTRQLAVAAFEPTELARALNLYGALRRIVDRYGLGGVTVRCFDLLSTIHTTGCLGLAVLNAEGVYAACESDVPSLISMAILGSVSGKPVFMCNPSRLEEPDRLVLAHCTLPLNMVERFTLRTHFESNTGVAVAGVLPETGATLFKTSGTLDRYHAEYGEILDNLSEESLCRTQIRMRITDPSYFLTRPIRNHHLLAIGDHTGALRVLFEQLETDGKRPVRD